MYKSFGLEIQKRQFCLAMTGSFGLILDSKLVIANKISIASIEQKCLQFIFGVKIDFRKLGTNRKNFKFKMENFRSNCLRYIKFKNSKTERFQVNSSRKYTLSSMMLSTNKNSIAEVRVLLLSFASSQH